MPSSAPQIAVLVASRDRRARFGRLCACLVRDKMTSSRGTPASRAMGDRAYVDGACSAWGKAARVGGVLVASVARMLRSRRSGLADAPESSKAMEGRVHNIEDRAE